MIKKKILFYLAIFLLIGFFSLTIKAFAQEELTQDIRTINISPLIFDLKASPGDILKDKIKIYNPSDKKLVGEMLIENFVPSDEYGQVQIVDLEPELEKTYSLKKWIKVEPNIFEVEPRQEKIVDFTIEIPNEAEPGGRYVSLVASVGGVGSAINGEGGSQILQKVASLILLSVSGDVKENLLVDEFKGPDFQEYGPVNFVLRLENQGTIHVRPKGFVAITNWQNEKVADLSIPQSAVLPGAKRTINISWNEKNILGKFTATLVGAYGSANQPISATWTFWIWPWKISLIILIVIILLLILFIRGRKRIGAAFKVLFKGDGSKNTEKESTVLPLKKENQMEPKQENSEGNNDLHS